MIKSQNAGTPDCIRDHPQDYSEYTLFGVQNWYFAPAIFGLEVQLHPMIDAYYWGFYLLHKVA